eukprot:CAMPEP_0202865094 /NCGR_PEP_ID=MMETSP1391-20130828/5238_1 /ASSEMBLY_ACC=CAM_ASM_000867 /TAXON_ID=1034604 /ORGANISM="Chlamydomonas leiostraca, Strain SAG 11-49" /LENGTH=280 /DNA_ID=CAMNT_0049544891 /DNA_START=38 /DNA_END=882 /DNA_ORIENTATION=+
MLRAAARAFLQGLPAGSAGYATTSATRSANPQDYSMVMKKAAEISATVVQKPNDKVVGICAGIPLDTYQRQVRIFSPAKTASQSGFARTNHNSASAPAWRIGFETTAKWENPLMGWTSTADPLENLGRSTLQFYNKEEAIAFAKKHGWAYSVDEPNQRRTARQKRFAAYGDNYSTRRKGLPDLTHLPSMRQGKEGLTQRLDTRSWRRCQQRAAAATRQCSSSSRVRHKVGVCSSGEARPPLPMPPAAVADADMAAAAAGALGSPEVGVAIGSAYCSVSSG